MLKHRITWKVKPSIAFAVTPDASVMELQDGSQAQESNPQSLANTDPKSAVSPSALASKAKLSEDNFYALKSTLSTQKSEYERQQSKLNHEIAECNSNVNTLQRDIYELEQRQQELKARQQAAFEHEQRARAASAAAASAAAASSAQAAAAQAVAQAKALSQAAAKGTKVTANLGNDKPSAMLAPRTQGPAYMHNVHTQAPQRQSAALGQSRAQSQALERSQSQAPSSMQPNYQGATSSSSSTPKVQALNASQSMSTAPSPRTGGPISYGTPGGPQPMAQGPMSNSIMGGPGGAMMPQPFASLPNMQGMPMQAPMPNMGMYQGGPMMQPNAYYGWNQAQWPMGAMPGMYGSNAFGMLPLRPNAHIYIRFDMSCKYLSNLINLFQESNLVVQEFEPHIYSYLHEDIILLPITYPIAGAPSGHSFAYGDDKRSLWTWLKNELAQRHWTLKSSK